MGLDGYMTVIPNQGYHIESYGIPVGIKIGEAEKEEELRADLIEAQCAERSRRERRNFKGYE